MLIRTADQCLDGDHLCFKENSGPTQQVLICLIAGREPVKQSIGNLKCMVTIFTVINEDTVLLPTKFSQVKLITRHVMEVHKFYKLAIHSFPCGSLLLRKYCMPYLMMVVAAIYTVQWYSTVGVIAHSYDACILIVDTMD